MRKKEDYIYAVARIRILESKLFSSKNIEQIISMTDTDSILRYLYENGWNVNSDVSDVFDNEEKALWRLMSDLVGDLSCFDFLRIQNDFLNLKATVKSVYSHCDPNPMLMRGIVFDSQEIYNAVLQKEYNKLPEFFAEPAEKAMNILFRTGDGQLSDAVLDNACLLCISEIGKSAKNQIIKEYCDMFVAFADIRIALRTSRLHKSADYILECMAECQSLEIKKLAVAASKNLDEICEYLSTTRYKNSVPFIKESLSYFEKWCDNFMMNRLRTQKYDPFSIGPLVAYIIAKQTEIKAVRLILTSKANGIGDEVIRERIREMYV